MAGRRRQAPRAIKTGAINTLGNEGTPLAEVVVETTESMPGVDEDRFS